METLRSITNDKRFAEIGRQIENLKRVAEDEKYREQLFKDYDM